MVSKKPSRHIRASHRHLKLKTHHGRAFRKRHVGLFVASLATLVMLGALLLSYRDQIISGIASSRSFVSDLFLQNNSSTLTVQSTYGFSFNYDHRRFYATGVNASDGLSYSGADLEKKRAYSVIRVMPNGTDGTIDRQSSSNLTLTVRPGALGSKETLDGLALQSIGLDSSTLKKDETQPVTIGGQTFQKTFWQSTRLNILAPSLTAKFVTYAAVVRGNVVLIVIPLWVGDAKELLYRDILQTLNFDTKLGVTLPALETNAQRALASFSLFDQLTNTTTAAASGGVDLSGSERVAALYTPAVIKIYNTYCMDIAIDGKSYLKDICEAATGSGFFVSQDGYIATNAHVVSAKPLDVVISHAVDTYATKGDPQAFNYMLSLTKLTVADIPAEATNDQKIAIMVDAMYSIDPQRITVSNDVQNLLVQVTAKNPDVTALLAATKARQLYAGDNSVISAKLVASDYRAIDGYDGFRASDVAVIKADGANFPIVKLGSIGSVRQGADLSILGYPSNAANNGIVDASSSEATLTTGKVSSIKNAANSDKKLIETDTTIGHGNSGGPALDNDGNVVGIATYTADGSGEGDGVFNYIRDIKDLTDLATDNRISFDTKSVTQQEWENGISDFYSAHYTKAVQSFKKVQTLYPNNSRVAEFMSAAESRIAKGEDVTDFPLTQVIIVSSIVAAGVIVGLVLIVRHYKKHRIYAAGLAQGSVLPAGPGVKTQTVFVTRSKVRVDSPLPLRTAPKGAIKHPEDGHHDPVV